MVNCPACGEENPPKFRLCGYCGAPLAGAAPAAPALPVREMRKTVTIVFSDLKDSTALGERLDAEALHEVKDRYFAAMADPIQRHGGKIEKYIGDAIMAVFGLPKAHEDDALRAVRAADDMRKALQRVNQDLMARYHVTLANRTGVNTGEVVANDDEKADQKLATGDAVNVAARLEQAAPPNEVYLGETTYRLVRDAVRVEAVEPLQLKGKAEKVGAYRLVAAQGLDGYARRQDTPIVGREAELAALYSAYHGVVSGQRTHLVTVIGDAGLGKSRLVRELTDQIAAGARTLRGRCLPYGDGITFWPLVSMVREAAGIADDDPPETARAKLVAAVGDAAIADRLASTVGLSTDAFPLHELYWGVRKFFEGMAGEQPVVVLVDDIHWAEPALLDLLIHLLDASTGAPILLLATARHDLIDSKPDWAQREASTRLVLRPLSEAAAAQVVANLLGASGLPAEIVQRIVTAAEGNPLYVEQMLAMLIDTQALRFEDGQWVRGAAQAEITVPPTIQALIEARLDGLGRADRAALEPAAVIGLEFPHAAVETMVPEAVKPTLPGHMDALAKRHLIRPGHQEHGELLYRFHHQLVRDTAYNGLLKRNRANLHLAFVRWADKINADRDRALEFQEILGYHLEQAHRYLKELGPLDEAGLAIGADAAGRLSSAGKRAFARGDLNAASNLLRRAIALLPADHAQRLQLLPQYGETLIGLGDFPGARAALDEAMAAAERTANPRLKASAQIVAQFIRLYGGESGDSSAEPATVVQALLPVLEREQAHHELAVAWRLVMLSHGIAGRYRQASDAAVHSIAYARQAGDSRLIAKVGGILTNTALLGTTPVGQAIEQCEQLIAGGLDDQLVEGNTLCVLAELRAMNGEFDVAQTLVYQGRSKLRDLENGVSAAASGISVAHVELLRGNLAHAEQLVRQDYQFLSRIGETYYLSSVAAVLARLVRDQGRDDEAMEFSKAAEAATAADDMESQVAWRAVRAPILARAGRLDEAEALARSAVDLALQTEAVNLQASALLELATVLGTAARSDEAGGLAERALRIYLDKGNLAAAERARALHARLRPA